MTAGFEGRKGPRTREQRIREMLRQAKGRNEKYGIGGREKSRGWKAPAVTLPKIGSDKR